MEKFITVKVRGTTNDWKSTVPSILGVSNSVEEANAVVKSVIDSSWESGTDPIGLIYAHTSDGDTEAENYIWIETIRYFF